MSFNLLQNSWKLQVRHSDNELAVLYLLRLLAGVYECQISTAPVRSLRFNLKVVGNKDSPFNLVGKLNCKQGQNNEIASRTFRLLIWEIEWFDWVRYLTPHPLCQIPTRQYRVMPSDMWTPGPSSTSPVGSSTFPWNSITWYFTTMIRSFIIYTVIKSRLSI